MQRSNKNRGRTNGYESPGYTSNTNNQTNSNERFDKNEPKINGRSPSFNGNGYGRNNSRVTDRHSPRIHGSVQRVNGSDNGGEISKPQCADLKKHMSQISTVTGLPHCTVSVPSKGPGRETLERMKNQRRVHTPRNIKLFDDDSDDGSQINRSCISNDFLNVTDMAASLRMTIADPIVSNNAIEKRWNHSKHSAPITTGQFIDKENAMEKPKKHGRKLEDMVVKNVAIRGIVEHRKEVKGATAAKMNAESKNVGEKSNNLHLVQDDTDPDFFYKKIQNTMPDDYFLVEHVGKITKVTPRQFLIDNIEPEHFEFPRTNKK